METSNKKSNGGFHVIGLMFAEMVISLAVITIGAYIGLGAAISAVCIVFITSIYVLPKINKIISKAQKHTEQKLRIHTFAK